MGESRGKVALGIPKSLAAPELQAHLFSIIFSKIISQLRLMDVRYVSHRSSVDTSLAKAAWCDNNAATMLLPSRLSNSSSWYKTRLVVTFALLLLTSIRCCCHLVPSTCS